MSWDQNDFIYKALKFMDRFNVLNFYYAKYIASYSTSSDYTTHRNMY